MVLIIYVHNMVFFIWFIFIICLCMLETYIHTNEQSKFTFSKPHFYSSQVLSTHLARLLWHFNCPSVNVINNIVWWPAINRATNSLCRAKDILTNSGHISCHGTRTHRISNRQYIVKTDVSTVLDTLLLLPITW